MNKFVIAAALAVASLVSAPALAVDYGKVEVRNGEPVILRPCEFSYDMEQDTDCLRLAAEALQDFRKTVKETDELSMDTLLVTHLELVQKMAAMSTRMMNYESRVSGVAQDLLIRADIDLRPVMDKAYKAALSESAPVLDTLAVQPTSGFVSVLTDPSLLSVLCGGIPAGSVGCLQSNYSLGQWGK